MNFEGVNQKVIFNIHNSVFIHYVSNYGTLNLSKDNDKVFNVLYKW